MAVILKTFLLDDAFAYKFSAASGLFYDAACYCTTLHSCGGCATTTSAMSGTAQ